MAGIDPNEEWLGYVQPIGLVIAPAVLKTYDLVPEPQTRNDTEAVKAHFAATEAGTALIDPWAFFSDILGWRTRLVAGSPGGASIPDELILRIEESDIEIAPHWAVTDPAGGWQILVRTEASGVDPEGRRALEGWEATPHQRLERLCREKQVKIGILVTDAELRLIYAPRGETSGWIRFPLRSLGEVGGRPMLGGLKLLLFSFRLHNDAPERRLSALLQASRDAQAEVSTKLAAQVLGTLHELMRGLHDADRERLERLAKERPEHVYDGLLTVLLRLVFLLYAEDRDLIPSRIDAAARALYDQGYGVRTLHSRLLEDWARHELTMHLRRGAWARLLALFRLVHRGDRSGEWIRGRGGKLFDPVAFPFLQGQDRSEDPPKPAEVSDECVLKVLDRLLVLGGEKLSYRTLDVEQIGSVYETVMGFTVETMTGPALAIRAGKNDRTPVFVDLQKLLAAKPADRAKFLKEHADRNKVPDKVDKALKAATTIEDLVAALTPIVDERASPGAVVFAPGTPLLQPTDERRRTGSHYTPRSLTAPIVQHALEPAFERISSDARPEDVLALKVCDPAMGSGAFLVEACRALGERLVMAWARWPETRPAAIPPDEDEPLHARRLVAQRCLYGVDKNPRAVDLAKLSLWLATLARDHEFTFLDHALKCGDSLVGLDESQIAAMHWDPSKPGLPLFRKFIADRVAEVAKKRAEIQAAPDDTIRFILEQKHRAVESTIADVRILGDAVLSAYFAEEKPRAREKRRVEIESWASGIGEAKWEALQVAAQSLRVGQHPISPFHWHVEFPEVFARNNPGFDGFVGNPPFLGGAKIWPTLGAIYPDWLRNIHERSGGKAVDLVAHFYRRAFNFLRLGGTFGLVGTKTVAQGDTREAGLKQICLSGGRIYSAQNRVRWPGEASVLVSFIHVSKGDKFEQSILDNRGVDGINSFLLPSADEFDAQRLVENRGRGFRGCDIYGQGFLFSDDPEPMYAGSIEYLEQLISESEINKEVIFPYIGGQEVASDPRQQPHRYAINFAEMSLVQASRWPALLDIVRQKVMPSRAKLSGYSVARRRQEYWWQYGTYTPALYRAIASFERVIAISRISTHICFAFLPARMVFNEKLVIIPARAGHRDFAHLQSRIHQIWALMWGSTLGVGDTPVYSPPDCLETFPCASGFEKSPALQAIGESYEHHRAQLMIENDQGMTSTYNRFHDLAERSPSILRLRELHAAMDRVVLEAYGWDDLAARAEPIFLDETNEDDRTYQGRLFWPSNFRDEVLARLLALNAERAKAEREAGLTVVTAADKLEEEDA